MSVAINVADLVAKRWPTATDICNGGVARLFRGDRAVAKLRRAGHAGWIGRRWAHRMRDRLADAVRAEVARRGLRSLDAVEDARERLWTATSAIDRGTAT